MTAAMQAGLRLGVLAALIGLVLGPVRELLLAPRIGGVWAAWVEVAAMLPLLWWAAGWALRPPPASRRQQGAAAVVAVGVVLAAEMLLLLAFDATGLSTRRAPRSLAEEAVGLVPLAWMAALPFLRRRAAA